MSYVHGDSARGPARRSSPGLGQVCSERVAGHLLPIHLLPGDRQRAAEPASISHNLAIIRRSRRSDMTLRWKTHALNALSPRSPYASFNSSWYAASSFEMVVTICEAVDCEPDSAGYGNETVCRVASWT